MNKRTGVKFVPRACQRCGGAAYLERYDEPEWRCLQCGRTVAESVIAQLTGEAPAPELAGRAA